MISTIILVFPYWGDERGVGGSMYFQNDKNGVLEVLEIKTFFCCSTMMDTLKDFCDHKVIEKVKIIE